MTHQAAPDALIRRPGLRLDRPAREWLAVVAWLAPVVLLLLLVWSRRWTTEDAFINFRVVDQFKAGHGLVFNQGQRVEVATSTLWLAILIVGSLVLPGLRIEWFALFAGLGLTAVGLLAAQAVCRQLWSRGRTGVVLVPAGLLVLVGYTPFWDWGTSGLETGLTFAWSGLSVLLVARHTADDVGQRRGRRTFAASAFIGLGVLVRPDLGLVAGALLVGLWYLDGGGWRRRAGLVLSAAAIPAAYQVFRMGYYGALVPNTALAKEAGGSDWSRGFRYFVDFARPSQLWWPCLALVVVVAIGWRARPPGRRLLVPVVAAWAGAALHAVYVLRIGGDYMHARMLLPALFLAVVPVASLPVPSLKPVAKWATIGVLTGLAAWSLVGAVTLRPSYDGGIDWHLGIYDMRGFMVKQARRQHPIRVTDYTRFRQVGVGWKLGELVVQHDDGLFAMRGLHFERQAVVPAGTGVVMEAGAIGVLGFAAGNDVIIFDLDGIANVVGSRLSVSTRGVAGHDKVLPRVWPLAQIAGPANESIPGVVDVNAALACGDLHELLVATQTPLTWHRFLANVVDSPRLTALRVPSDPAAARAKFCGGSGTSR